MVTPNEVETPSEIESSLDTAESLSVEGDQPLIPADWDERQEALAATDNEETTSDEATSDEVVTPNEEEPSVANEEVSSPDTEEPVAEAVVEAEVVPEGRNRSDDEWNKREATYRSKEAENANQLAAVQAQVAQLQSTYSDQVLNAEVRGYEQSLIKQLTDDGHDESSAQRIASQQSNAAKAAYQSQQRADNLQAQLNQTTQSQEATARNASVERMMQTHGVPDSQRHLLQGYSDPALLVEAAEVLGNAEKQRIQTIEARQAEVPSGGEANKFDGGKGTGGSITDSQWLSQYSNGLLPDTDANDNKAYKILSDRGEAPQF